MPKLGVNIDHVASIRELRKGLEPQVAIAASLCEESGVDSLVVHLREDRRHIKEKDLILLKKTIRTKLNLEMSIAEDIVSFACKVKPQQATFVPERRKELTTEGGLDVVKGLKRIGRAFDLLKKKGIQVSLFIDPDKKQIDASGNIGVHMIELHTGRYADARDKKEQDSRFLELKNAALYAKNKGLRVFAGHGLNYNNVKRICTIKEIEELNIGYSIICRAVMVGLGQAVREMKELIS